MATECTQLHVIFHVLLGNNCTLHPERKCMATYCITNNHQHSAESTHTCMIELHPKSGDRQTMASGLLMHFIRPASAF